MSPCDPERPPLSPATCREVSGTAPTTLQYARPQPRGVRASRFMFALFLLALGHVVICYMLLDAAVMFAHRSRYAFPAQHPYGWATTSSIAFRRAVPVYLLTWSAVNTYGCVVLLMLIARARCPAIVGQCYALSVAGALTIDLGTYLVLFCQAPVYLHLTPDMSVLSPFCPDYDISVFLWLGPVLVTTAIFWSAFIARRADAL